MCWSIVSGSFTKMHGVTAEIRWFSNTGAMCRSASGSTTESASRQPISSAFVCSSPRFIAVCLPPFSLLKIFTRASLLNCSSAARVPSLEPSSTRISSSFPAGYRSASSDSTVPATVLSSLKHGTTTATVGSVASFSTARCGAREKRRSRNATSKNTSK